MAAPAAGRERWADLQGSVSGMLEEMSALSNRVESLDEKLRAKISACEELVRQKTRDLEQQLHQQQQKVASANAMFEETSKRQTSKMRKLTQSVEDTARRLSMVDELRNRIAGSDNMQIEARLSELQQQQATLEDEFRNLLMATESASTSVALFNSDPSMRGGEGLTSSGRSPRELTIRAPEDDGTHGGIDTAVMRALERDVGRLSQTIEEHAAALANLRVKSDGQEQRLSARYERLESVVNGPLDSVRTEVMQLRERDRQDMESQVQSLVKRMEALADQSDEAISELRDSLERAVADIRATGELPHGVVDEGMGNSVAQLRRVAEQHDYAIRRLEAHVSESQKGGGMFAEDLDVMGRLESLEHRVSYVEQGSSVDEIEQKADRTEVVRLDNALQEVLDPLRRLASRTASSEAKTAALERQLERLRQSLDSVQLKGGIGNGATGSPTGGFGAPASASPQTLAASDELAASVVAASSRAEGVAQELGVLRARLLEVESQLESGGGEDGASRSLRGSRREPESHLEPVSREQGQQIGDLVARVGRLSDRLGSQEDMILKLVGQQEQLAQNAGGAADGGRAELERARASIADVRGEVEERFQDVLRKQTETFSALGGDLQAQLDELRSQHQETEIAVRAYESAAKQFQTQSQQQHQMIQQKLEEVASARGGGSGEGKGSIDNQRFSEMLDRIDEDRRASETLHEGAQKQIDELRAKVEGVAESVGTASEALSRVAKAEEALATVQSTCDVLSAKADALSGDAEESARRTAAFEEELKSIRGSSDATHELHKELQTQLADLEQRQLEDKPGSVVDAEAITKDAETRAAALVESQVEKLAQRIDSSDKKCAGQEARLDEALKRLEGRLGKELEELEAKMERQLSEIEGALQQKKEEPKGQEEVSEALERMREIESELGASLKDVQAKLQDVVAKQAEAVVDPFAVAASEERDQRIADAIEALKAGEVSSREAEEKVQNELGALRAEVRALADSGPLEASGAAVAPVGASAAEVESKVSELRQSLQADFEQRLEKLRGEVAQGSSDDVEESVADALQKIKALGQKQTQAEKATADLQKDMERSNKRMEERLDKLRIDHELLSKQQVSSGGAAAQPNEGDEGLAAKVSEVFDKAVAGEVAIADLKKALQAEQARLWEQIQQTTERVEFSEAATKAVREELMSAAPGSPNASKFGGCSAALAEDAKQLEAKVLALMDFVTKEADALKEHQQQLDSHAKGLAVASTGGSGMGAAALENAVKGLLRQADVELSELRMHQKQLDDAKGHLLFRPGNVGGAEVARLEKRLTDIAASFAEELKVVEEQQKSISQKKAGGGSDKKGGLSSSARGKPKAKGGGDESDSYADDFEASDAGSG